MTTLQSFRLRQMPATDGKGHQGASIMIGAASLEEAKAYCEGWAMFTDWYLLVQRAEGGILSIKPPHGEWSI